MAWLKAADRPDTTIGLRLWQLRRFAEDHPRPWPMTTDRLAEWLARQDWATETKRSQRAALRSFYGWAYAMGRTPSNPAALLPPIRPVQHRARPAPESVLRAALAATDGGRVELMVLLAARQGLRRGEISRVHSDDLVEDFAGWSLRVHGKGAKIRIIPLHDDMAARLHALPAGWAFPGASDGHLSPAYVGKLMSRALGPGWTAHTLRHRFGTTAYAGCRDLLAVQELLGHSKPETTRQYVQLPDDALRAGLRGAA